jgi:hypothetical protein
MLVAQRESLPALLLLSAIVLASLSRLPVPAQVTTTTQTEQLYDNQQFTIPGIQSGSTISYCSSEDLPIILTAGDKLLGKASSSYPGGVYLAIMTPQQYSLFLYSTGRTCASLAQANEYYKIGQSFQVQWTASSSGSYRLVFGNPNYAPTTVTLSLTRISVLVSSSHTTSSHSTLSSRSTSRTTSPTFLTTQTTAYSVQSLLHGITSPLLLAASGVIVGILIVVAIVTIPKKKRTVAEELFCINCGAKLPAGSKFCNKCGVTQA